MLKGSGLVAFGIATLYATLASASVPAASQTPSPNADEATASSGNSANPILSPEDLRIDTFGRTSIDVPPSDEPFKMACTNINCNSCGN